MKARPPIRVAPPPPVAWELRPCHSAMEVHADRISPCGIVRSRNEQQVGMVDAVLVGLAQRLAASGDGRRVRAPRAQSLACCVEGVAGLDDLVGVGRGLPWTGGVEEDRPQAVQRSVVGVDDVHRRADGDDGDRADEPERGSDGRPVEHFHLRFSHKGDWCSSNVTRLARMPGPRAGRRRDDGPW